MEKGAFALYILTDRKSKSICIVSHGYKAAQRASRFSLWRSDDYYYGNFRQLQSCCSTVVKAKRESIFGGSSSVVK